MEKMISKSKFKPKALELFRQVQQTGEPIVITDFGKPVLKIVPYEQKKTKEILKELKGSLIRYDDPTEPVALDSWEVM